MLRDLGATSVARPGIDPRQATSTARRLSTSVRADARPCQRTCSPTRPGSASRSPRSSLISALWRAASLERSVSNEGVAAGGGRRLRRPAHSMVDEVYARSGIEDTARERRGASRRSACARPRGSLPSSPAVTLRHPRSWEASFVWAPFSGGREWEEGGVVPAPGGGDYRGEETGVHCGEQAEEVMNRECPASPLCVRSRPC